MAKSSKRNIVIFAISLSFNIVLISLIAFGSLQSPPDFRGDKTIEISKEDLKTLELRFKESGNEYLYCLIGTQVSNTYKITSIEEVEGDATESSFSFRGIPCEESKFIGTLHKHPGMFQAWQPSNADTYFFGRLDKPLNIIQYGPSHFYANEYINNIDTRNIEMIEIG